MARLGLLLVHDGVWDGQRLLDPEWVYKITHPAFEDINTGYGYLTWVAAERNQPGIVDWARKNWDFVFPHQFPFEYPVIIRVRRLVNNCDGFAVLQDRQAFVRRVENRDIGQASLPNVYT